MKRWEPSSRCLLPDPNEGLSRFPSHRRSQPGWDVMCGMSDLSEAELGSGHQGQMTIGPQGVGGQGGAEKVAFGLRHEG